MIIPLFSCALPLRDMSPFTLPPRQQPSAPPLRLHPSRARGLQPASVTRLKSLAHSLPPSLCALAPVGVRCRQLEGRGRSLARSLTALFAHGRCGVLSTGRMWPRATRQLRSRQAVGACTPAGTDGAVEVLSAQRQLPFCAALLLQFAAGAVVY